MKKVSRKLIEWTDDECQKFADAMQDKPDELCALELSLQCGLRIGEVLALTANDFDLTKSAVKVERSIRELKDKVEIMPPKTLDSYRTVPVSKDLMEQIKGIMKQKEPNERMFPMSKDMLRASMQEGIQKAGIRPLGIYELRHNYLLRERKWTNVP